MVDEIQMVLWVDSTEGHGWVDHHSLPEIAKCRTVGFLVSEDDDKIVLASSEDQTNGNFNGVMAIPKFAINARQVARINPPTEEDR